MAGGLMNRQTCASTSSRMVDLLKSYVPAEEVERLMMMVGQQGWTPKTFWVPAQNEGHKGWSGLHPLAPTPSIFETEVGQEP